MRKEGIPRKHLSCGAEIRREARRNRPQECANKPPKTAANQINDAAGRPDIRAPRRGLFPAHLQNVSLCCIFSGALTYTMRNFGHERCRAATPIASGDRLCRHRCLLFQKVRIILERSFLQKERAPKALNFLVEITRLELVTYTLRTYRATNCAISPCNLPPCGG